MNKNRIIFYLVFLAFHVGAYLFTFRLEDVSFLMKLVKYIGWFQYITFFGIVLIVTDIVWAWKVNREVSREKDSLTKELTNLKAKLFDMQEEIAKGSEPAPAAKDTPKVN